MVDEPGTTPAPLGSAFAGRWLAIAALGAIGVFGSETLFWSAPPTPLTPVELLLTWLAYALSVALPLMILSATGARGWLAVFLAGCIYGWLIEGVVVQTVYDVFPFTLVFTGMSWHALLVALLIGLAVRRAPSWSLPRQLLFLGLLGLFFSLWALYWPLERPALAEPATIALYLCGLGLVVPLANLLLDRLPPRLRFSHPEIAVVATLFTLAWLIQFITAPDLRRLTVPLAILITIWLLHRLGSHTGFSLGTTPPARQWRHWLFLIVPAIVTAMAVLVWPSGIESNWPIAIGTSLIALALYARAAVRVLFRR